MLGIRRAGEIERYCDDSIEYIDMYGLAKTVPPEVRTIFEYVKKRLQQIKEHSSKLREETQKEL